MIDLHKYSPGDLWHDTYKSRISGPSGVYSIGFFEQHIIIYLIFQFNQFWMTAVTGR